MSEHIREQTDVIFGRIDENDVISDDVDHSHEDVKAHKAFSGIMTYSWVEQALRRAHFPVRAWVGL